MRMIIMGNPMVIPAIPYDPKSGLFPIKMRSTTLYRAFTIIPTIAGTENLTNNFDTFSVPRGFTYSISVVFQSFL
ncbi:hypothetical protein [uncultured Sphaerochaeta sp.]|uniref:hypothetical protein n=1 Tax=uncultured Sphaerochaeta sp. TaxID=886478 RepID=UPI002A0A454D|nr:hypothetical protein [uncultured Sphaerochaeta sp.]